MASTAGGKRILISGASGLIGSELTRQLEADGHTVLRLVRREPRSSSEFQWFPSDHTIDASLPDSTDAVINLSGASIGRIPWTTSYKREILRSRVDATRTLAEAMNQANTPPAVFLSASAVGFYGDRPGVALDETATKGTGFLPDVVDAWEQAANLAPSSTRVVTFRTGLVVADGGAFTPLQLATRFGLAARLGSGRQYWPWISVVDEAAAIRHLLTSTLSGVVNLAGPTPATSLEVTRALAGAMHRWHALAIPRQVIELGLGDAGRELLLSDQRMVPAALLDDGFVFTHPTIEDAIAATWG